MERTTLDRQSLKLAEEGKQGLRREGLGIYDAAEGEEHSGRRGLKCEDSRIELLENREKALNELRV